MKMLFNPAALLRLRGSADKVFTELEEMKEEAARTQSGVTIHEFFKKRRYKQPIIIVLIINLGSQLSGFNAVSFISMPLLKSSVITVCLIFHMQRCSIYFYSNCSASAFLSGSYSGSEAVCQDNSPVPKKTEKSPSDPQSWKKSLLFSSRSSIIPPECSRPSLTRPNT